MNHRTCLKAWSIFFLVATVGGAIFGFFVGAIMGGIMGAAGVDLDTIKMICTVVGVLIGIPISYFTFYWVVSQFILKPTLLSTMVTTDQAPQPPPLLQPNAGSTPTFSAGNSNP